MKAVERHTQPARVCERCGRWPCACVASYLPHVVVGPLVMPCACGLNVSTPTMLFHDVNDAVQRHNIEPLHERWREANGL